MFGWTSPPQVQPVPILSHHQTRSYESSEESKMSEERGTSKSRTVFEKTTCELLTEKSVTTFGRMPNAKVPTASKQSKRQKEQQPIRVVQQRQRLPRISQEELNGTYLYTRYGEEEDRRPVEVREESAYVQQSNGDSSGREWRVTEEQSSVVKEMSRTTKSWKAPEGRVDERTTTPLRAQTTRLIDFETYKKEVEQLQRKAAATGNGNTSIELLPLAPAIVVAPGHKKEMALPKAKQPTLEATLKYFSNEELITETIKEASGNKEESEKKRRETEHKRREGEAEEEWERVEKEARDCMEERRKKRLEVEDEEKKERTRENEDKLRRMEEDKLRRMEEDKLRRMEEDELRRMEEDKLRRMEEEKLRRMEEDKLRRMEEDKLRRMEEDKLRRMEEDKLRRMEEDKLRRMEEDKLRRMEEDELRRMEEEFRKEKPSLIRPQPVYVSIASEYHHEEMDSEQRVKVMEEKGGKEPGREKEEERNKPEGEVEKEEEQRKEQREEVIPIEFEADAGRGLGRHLLETLSRELQYQEEIDMEVSRRRRKIVADGGEEPEAEEEGRGDEHEDEEVRMGQKKKRPTEEEEEEPELPRMVDTGGEHILGGRVPQQQQKAAAATCFVPIHRHGAKVSISGELSLPPVREEGEDEEPTFEDKAVEETGTTQTVPSRKRVPPPPPPKPPHSIFGTGTAHQQTTAASEPHLRESSFSSVYSNFPQTYSTLHTYNTMDSPASSDYRSAISSRPYFPRPRPLSPARYSSDGGPRVLKMVSECSSISSRPMSPYPGSTAASAIRDAREREKKEMSELNDRLANYIEKAGSLYAWGKDASNVREMYETDLRQAKKLLEEAQRQKDELEKKAKAMGDEMETLMKKHADALSAHDEDKKLMEELLLNLSSLEAELGTLKRRLGILEDDLKALRRENQHLSGETHKAKTDLDQETLNRIDYQNQVQTLLEEIDFLRRAHEAEIQDLQAMASRDTTGENREFFRNELASAIREIRSNYDALDTRNRSDIESWYKMKVQEIQTMSARQNLEQNYAKEEVKRLRTQLGDLRGKLADLEGRNSLLERQVEELAYQVEDDQRAYESALNDKDSQIRKLRDEAQALMLELQMLLDTKQTLDAEIAIYRKMLEGEEDRSGLYQLVEQVVKSQNIRRQDEAESQRVLRGEKSSRQSYQRSAKGNVSVLETSPEGKYMVLENTHRSKEEPIGGWKLRRRIDGKREIMYTFPQEFVLRPGKTVKVWARGQGLNAPPDQLVSDGEESFGTGSNVQTLLYNRDGEERASLIQRSSGR
uniref:Trichohyalin-like n=1 Tax=Globodera pallida TaxID=36090 RepID=A0A183CK98_GLOPA